MADSTNSIIGLIDFDGTLFDTDGLYDTCIGLPVGISHDIHS